MAQSGIQDDDGSFNRPTLDEIEQRITDEAKEQFGEDVDLSQGSPIKQLIDTVILEHEYLWQLLEDVYYSAYYGHAYEEQLDKLMALTQFNRIPRRGATGEVTFSVNVANDEDVVIPENTMVSTPEEDDRPPIPFKTTEPARLPAGSSSVSNVPIRAAEPWEVDIGAEWLGAETNVAARTITVFETPVQGVEFVTNPHPTGEQSREDGYSYTPGRDREEDDEFRRRFEREFGAGSSATLDALRANMLALPGIRNADIEENVTSEVDENGLPPKCFRLTVLGDEDPDTIAQRIVETRSAGIESFSHEADAYEGSDPIDDLRFAGRGVTDDGKERVEYFDWAESIQIYGEISIEHTDDFPDDGALQVEHAILDYIGGETAGGEEYPGTGMGEDVVYDQVFKAAMSVPGTLRADVQIGTAEDDLHPLDIEIEDPNSAITDYTDMNILTQNVEVS